MKQEIFVIGDIHGEFAMMEKMVEKWDQANQELLFLGDLIDRGPDSRKCLEYAHHLIEKEGAKCLMGNHEDLLLRFLKHPHEYAANYFLNGGWKTLENLLTGTVLEKMSPVKLASAVIERYPDIIRMIQEMPAYYEWHHYLFVHAGVDLTQSNWHDTATDDYMWIRDPFHQQQNRTGKTIVFGHTPTFLLHKNSKNSQIWQRDQKIGMDGGAVFGGTLHGLVFNQNEMVHHYGVRRDNHQELITEVYC